MYLFRLAVQVVACWSLSERRLIYEYSSQCVDSALKGNYSGGWASVEFLSLDFRILCSLYNYACSVQSALITLFILDVSLSSFLFVGEICVACTGVRPNRSDSEALAWIKRIGILCRRLPAGLLIRRCHSWSSIKVVATCSVLGVLVG